MRFQIYFALLGAFLIEKKSLIPNGHLVGTGLEENLGDTSSYTAGLQPATVEVNLSIKPDTPFDYLLCKYTSV